jgi:hypothetical protein
MLEWFESFDKYASQQDMGVYGWQNPTSANFGPGRFSYVGFTSKSLNPYNSAGGNPYLLLPSGSLATRTIGFAFKYSGTTNQGPLCTLWDGSTAQFSISYAAGTANLYVQAGAVGSLGPITGGVCSGVYGAGQFYYVEFQSTIGSAGSVTVKVGGVTVLTLSGVNLQQSANAYANILSFGGLFPGTLYIDDAYVTNPTGAAPTGFLGESKIIYAPPTADSTHGNTGWIPNTGTTEYTQVDGYSPSGNTNYIATGTPGAKSTFSFALPTFTGTIDAVQLCASVEKTDVGSHTVAAAFESGGTTYVSPNAVSVTSSYSGALSIMTTNPATSSAFLAADVTGNEFGIALVS